MERGGDLQRGIMRSCLLLVVKIKNTQLDISTQVRVVLILVM